jgi:hypothetical protein
MDWKNFIVEITNNLAWPIVTIIIVLLFRKSLINLTKRISKIETSNGKIELYNEFVKINEELKDIELNDRSWINEMEKIAEINPRAAIIEAWTTIELSCIKKGFTTGSAIQRFNPKSLEDYLKNIDESLSNKIKDLRNLRNKLVHEHQSDFDFINAKKYIELSDKIITILNRK